MRALSSGIVYTALALIAVAPNAATAHFLWIDVPAPTAPDATPGAVVSFNEDAAPGSARLAGKIAATQATLRTATSAAKPLELSLVKNDDTGYLASPIGAAQPYALDGQFTYGLFRHDDEAILLTYYASHVAADEPAAVTALTAASQLPLHIVPRVTADGCTFEVLWHDKPAAGCQVVVETPSGDSRELESDAEGRVRLDPFAPGKYAVRARKVENREGDKDGQAYQAEHHYATLTAQLTSAGSQTVAATAAAKTVTAAKPTVPNEEPTAEALLVAARDGRATWEGLDGFTADVVIREGAEHAKGKIKVGENGEVELTGFGDFKIDRILRMLESLVQHRSGGGGPTGGVSFVADEREHPLGPMIRFNDDEDLQSAYRVQDNVVTEVNRVMGPMRFTISVLDVHRNPEGKYLPTSFNVSYWDKASGELKSSESHLNEWVRVGKFDLPRRIIVLRAEDGKRDLLSIDFSNHQLTEAKPE